MKGKRKRYLSLLLIASFILVAFQPIFINAKDNSVIVQENYTISYHTTSDWTDGFNGELVISNTGNKAISNWFLEFDFDRNIQNFWTAKILSHEQNHYKITHDGWNNIIKPGETITLGFGGNQGQKSDEPKNYKLYTLSSENGAENENNSSDESSSSGESNSPQASSSRNNYFVDIKITSQWEKQYNAEVTIENKGENPIENWQIIFDSEDEITNIWNAEIKSNKENTYSIKNANWNQDIQPNQKVKFGYTAKYKETIHLPEDFSMDVICVAVDKNLYEYKNNITSRLENGFTGEIEIKNISDRIIEDWKLTFEYPVTITNFYDAEIMHQEGFIYFVDNKGYNSNLLPGQTIKLGYISSSPASDDISKVDLLEMKLYDRKDYIIDSDQDNISDNLEIEEYKTDPNKKDTDGDGYTDYDEIFILLTDPLKKDNPKKDTDEDGIKDINELKLGTDPLNPDTDEDGLSDYDEIYVYKTDPLNSDTDGDGLLDGEEISLHLNPLLKDSKKDGKNDSKRYIKQTYSEALDDNKISNIVIDIECQGYIDNNIFIMDLGDIFDVNAKGMVSIPVDVDIMTKYKNLVISFEYNKRLLDKVKKENLMVAFYEEDSNYYTLINTSVSKKNNSVSAAIQSSGIYFLVDKSKLSKKERKDKKVAIAQRGTVLSSNTNKTKLKKEILTLMKKDSSFKGIKKASRIYSLEQAFDIVMKYNKEINSAAKGCEVHHALIQAVLMREIACINQIDIGVDWSVAKYFQYEQELEEFLNYPLWKQFLVGPPTAPIPIRQDSSTGLGQIFAKTAIKALNYFIGDNKVKGLWLNPNDWKVKRRIWQNLKYDDAFNIGKVALILKHEAKLEKIDSLKELTKDNAVTVLGKYNGNMAYGRLVYKYAKLFKKYKV